MYRNSFKIKDTSKLKGTKKRNWELMLSGIESNDNLVNTLLLNTEKAEKKLKHLPMQITFESILLS